MGEEEVFLLLPSEGEGGRPPPQVGGGGRPGLAVTPPNGRPNGRQKGREANNAIFSATSGLSFFTIGAFISYFQNGWNSDVRYVVFG